MNTTRKTPWIISGFLAFGFVFLGLDNLVLRQEAAAKTTPSSAKTETIKEKRGTQEAAKGGTSVAPVLSAKNYGKFSGVFTGGKGTRLDFAPQRGGLKVDDDSSSYTYAIVLPDTGTKATIVLSGPAPEGSLVRPEPEAYDVEILQRSEDMVVMKMVLTEGEELDRFQLYTLHPKAGVGYCVTVSAYINGTEEMKALAALEPRIPVASANTVSFFRVD